MWRVCTELKQWLSAQFSKQEASTQKLIKKVDKLNKRVKKLDKRVSKVEQIVDPHWPLIPGKPIALIAPLSDPVIGLSQRNSPGSQVTSLCPLSHTENPTWTSCRRP